MSDTPQLMPVKSGSHATAQKSEETTLGLPLEKIGGSLFDYQQGLNEPKKPWFSMIYVLFFLLAVAAAWASFFDINETVRSQGQFIPSARTQIVQVVDGGVLAELKVHEGDFVEAGQVLAVLERQRANAGFEESRAKVASLKARLIRAQAQVNGISPDFSSLINSYTDFVTVEQGVYKQRKLSLDGELSTLMTSKLLADEELKMNESLYSTGDVSRLEVMRSESQVIDLDGQMSQLTNTYRQTAQREASEIESEYASARFQLKDRQNVLDHTQLFAPVAGIVKSLKVNTLGGVLRPGEELMHISPSGEVLIEVKLNPVDIGQLVLGMPVSIKVDAYDFSIYGSINGSLNYISSDTLVENEGGRTNIFYLAQIQVFDSTLQPKNRLAAQTLIPGMTVSVDIKTGTRSVMEYLAKPIVRAFAGALTER
jgi:adhesin transport system membrane fusion protein